MSGGASDGDGEYRQLQAMRMVELERSVDNGRQQLRAVRSLPSP